MNIGQLYEQLQVNNYRALARAISIVENEVVGYKTLLQQLQFKKATPVIGITGPPGAGKSTLVNALIHLLLQQNHKVAIIAVDPTSPFNYGALLGDRIRLSDHYNHPHIFIRSLATRGSLGGLSDKIIEVTDVLRAADFDYILLETVGVGQSEVEVAGLADTSIVTLVPEAGDEIQTMKAGLMEIADVFVVNKSDRADADAFARNLRKLVHAKPASNWNIPVIKTIATRNDGLQELLEAIQQHHLVNLNQEKKSWLLTQKALRIIQKQRMSDIEPKALNQQIATQLQNNPPFNLYTFLDGVYGV